jgi:lipoprotein-anchoring transpeptidase ErfK/SrfK
VRIRQASRAGTPLLLVVALLIIGVGGWRATHQHRTVQRLAAATTTATRTVAVAPVDTRAAGAPPDASAVVAHVAALQVFRAAGRPALVTTLADPTSYGAPLVLLVVGQAAGWWQVSLPIRPNGSTGWVRASDVDLRTVPYQITIAQHTHTARLWRDGTYVRSFPIAVGKPATPSPDGLFFINVIIDNVGGNQAYGPWVMGLSGFSNVLSRFAGGDAAVAMHGTDEDSSVGTSASHGCFRMHDADATTLAHLVTLGTPVYVTP